MTTPASFAPIPLKDLRFSTTTAQSERRKRFDKAAIHELADSIISIGLQQPIVVRPIARSKGLNYLPGDPTHEVVAGERRVLAARQAKLEQIDAIVRELDDSQVLEVQLVENLQREGLHELVEAEGYETLMKQHRFTVDDLVAKVGKSKAYVYARLKLTALCPEARKAFHDGKLTASTALLVARIPIHDLQRQALKEITKPNDWNDQPLSYRAAAEHVREHYMLQLADAPFPTGDTNLVPAAGPCGSCPKRTGNQKELFGDVKGADVCTDPVCFAAKKAANLARLATAAEASGKEVISGAAAKKIAPDGVGQYSSLKGHVRLDDRFWSGNKQKTYRSAIGKDVEVKHLQDPESGKLVEIAAESEVQAALKKRGVKQDFGGGGNDRYKAEQRARDRKLRIEVEFRRRLYAEIRAKHPAKADRATLELMASAYWHRLWHDTAKVILKLWDAAPEKRKGGHGQDVKGPLERRIPKMTEAELVRFILDCGYAHELSVPPYSIDTPEDLLAAAKRLRINADKLKREVVTEMAPKRKPAKKAKARA